MKYKVGDELIIIDKIWGHGFRLGEHVKVLSVNDNAMDYGTTNDVGQLWFVKNKEVVHRYKKLINIVSIKKHEF